jgi:hypothetical protein
MWFFTATSKAKQMFRNFINVTEGRGKKRRHVTAGGVIALNIMDSVNGNDAFRRILLKMKAFSPVPGCTRGPIVGTRVNLFNASCNFLMAVR